MNPSFFNIQKGGEKTSKSRTIKGVRYLNSDSVFLKSNSRDTGRELPDSLSSLDSVESPQFKPSSFSMPMGMEQMAPMGMNMPGMGMGMNMPGMGMNMAPMGMNMAPMAQMQGLNHSQPVESNFNSMSGLNNQISNDQLVKLGIMPPMSGYGGLAKTSADLRMGQMGGASTEYIDIAKPNFFF
jgi:hypothetical protein